VHAWHTDTLSIAANNLFIYISSSVLLLLLLKIFILKLDIMQVIYAGLGGVFSRSKVVVVIYFF